MGNKNTIAIELVVNDNGSVTLKQFGDTVKKTFGDTRTSTESAAKGMRDADSATRTLSESMGGMESAVKKVVAAVGAYKIAEFAKDAALQAARYETLGVVMGVVGRNAGYSQERMDGFSAALQKSGISMIESREGITRMAQAQLNLSQSTDLARVAQDAAVIGNINSSEAFNRMIVGIQTGQVEILRTIGINVNFEESYRRVATATKRTVDSFTEAEKAQIRMNAVMEAGGAIAGTYEAAMTTAGKKLTSFTRYVDDFKVKMGEAFGPATVTLVDAATETMKKMQDEIQKPETQKALKDISTEIANLAVGLGTSLPGALVKTTNAISGLMTVYNAIPGEIVGAAGVGIMGKIIFGSVPIARALAAAYLAAGLITKVKGEIEATTGAISRAPLIVGEITYGGSDYRAELLEIEKKAHAAKIATDILEKLTIPRPGPTIANLADLKADKAIYDARIKPSTLVDADKLKKMADKDRQGMLDGIKAQMDADDELYLSIAENTARRLAEEERLRAEDWKGRMAGIEAETAEYERGLIAAGEAVDAKKKLAVERLSAERDMYEDMRGFEQNYFTTTMLMIESQAKKYRELGISEITIAKWIEGEKTKALTAYVDKAGSLYQRLTEITRKYKEDAGDIHKALFNTLDSGFKTLEGQISDNFFNALTGQFEKVRLDWDSMWASMARSASNYVAKIATTAAVDYGGKAISSGIGWLASNYGGGILDVVSGWLGLSAGQYVVDKDKLALLHQGEMVLPAELAGMLRALVASSGGYAGPQSEFSMSPQDLVGPTMGGLISETYADSIGKGGAYGAFAGLVAGGVPGAFAGGMTGLGRGLVVGSLMNLGHVMGLTDLGRVAGYIDDNLASPEARAGYAAFAEAIAAMANIDRSDREIGEAIGGGISGTNSANSGINGPGGDDDGPGWRYGGIPTGPESGYWARLHGTEAVVPLPDGRSIPVEVRSNDSPQASGDPVIIHTHVYLDKREIALAVADETETNDRLVVAFRKAVK